nr:SHOCT domain-containing protein [Arthrobacter sp. Br18]
MGGNGFGMGGMWLFGLLVLVGVILLVFLVVRFFAAGNRGNPSAGNGDTAGGAGNRSAARQILDERYAKGELTDEEYAQRRRTLSEGT